MSESTSETWATGEMVCLNCGEDEGVHVWMVGSEPVECPVCSQMKMVPKDTVPTMVPTEPVLAGHSGR